MAVLQWQRVIRLLLIHFIDIISTQTDSTAVCPYNATGVVPPVQALHEWNYLGCYHDDHVNRILNSTGYSSADNNTVTGCAKFCEGYAFLGVEFGAQCFCGVSLGVAANTKPTSDAQCNYTCCADRTVSCGGAEYINVYETIEPSPTSTLSLSPSSTAPSTSPSPHPSNSLSTGVKAELGVLASIAGLGIIFALWFFLFSKPRSARQRKNHPQRQENQSHDKDEVIPLSAVKQRYPGELSAEQQDELDGNTRSELDGRAKMELEARKGALTVE